MNQFLASHSFLSKYRGEFDYYIKLIRDGGEWESWLSFFLRVVIDASY